MTLETIKEFLFVHYNAYSLAAGLVVGLVIGLCVRCCRACPSRKERKPAAGQKPAPRREKAPAAPKQPPVVLAPGDVELYVGNLSYDTTEDGLRKEFERFGKVSSARVVTNRFNGKSKGFGFVVMPNRPEAEAAVKGMNDKEFQGRKLRVNEARGGLPRE